LPDSSGNTVQNSAYGGPEVLPFDLRGRRITAYELEKGSADRSEARGLLQGRLEAAIKGILHSSNYVSLPAGSNVPLWWGQWSIEAAGQARGGSLFIREIGAAGFQFDLSVFNGSHIGNLTSYARIVSSDVAYARVTNGTSGDIGEIVFRRSIDGHRRTITLNETASCSHFRGMGAFFGGEFTRRSDGLFDGGFLNELDLARLYTISSQAGEAAAGEVRRRSRDWCWFPQRATRSRSVRTYPTKLGTVLLPYGTGNVRQQRYGAAGGRYEAVSAPLGPGRILGLNRFRDHPGVRHQVLHNPARDW
jgi:hypothetical protein